MEDVLVSPASMCVCVCVMHLPLGPMVNARLPPFLHPGMYRCQSQQIPIDLTRILE